MAEEHPRHHLFHHKNEDEQPVAVVETTDVYTQSVVDESGKEKARREIKHTKHEEHMGQLSAAAAGTFALYEKHEAKKDPEHAHRHKLEEEVAATAAVGAGGFALHEHHNKKDEKKEEEEAEGRHKHHHF